MRRAGSGARSMTRISLPPVCLGCLLTASAPQRRDRFSRAARNRRRCRRSRLPRPRPAAIAADCPCRRSRRARLHKNHGRGRSARRCETREPSPLRTTSVRPASICRSAIAWLVGDLASIAACAFLAKSEPAAAASTQRGDNPRRRRLGETILDQRALQRRARSAAPARRMA